MTLFHAVRMAALTLAVLSLAPGTGGPAAAAETGAAAPKATKKPRREKIVIGRLEQVHIGEAGFALAAKVDTGTQTSSLHAENIELFRRDSRDYVRFTIAGPDEKPVTLERPLVRLARFKDNARNAPLRPIVTLGLCIGTLYRRTQVNLTDRWHFDYPVLIGRRFLFGHAVVDTAKKYTAKPACREMTARD